MLLASSRRYLGIMLVVLSSIFFAFVPNTAKIAMDEGSSLLFLIISRYAIGALFLLPVMFATNTPLLVPKNVFPKIIKVSLLALGLILATYHAVNFLDVGIVLIILYSFPIGVAIFFYLKKQIKITFKQCLCMASLMTGLLIMIYDGNVEMNLYGLIISFIGLLFFVLFIAYSGEILEVVGSRTLNFYISFFGLFFLLAALCIIPDSVMQAPASTKGIIAITANGIFYILSWVLYFEGSYIIGTTRASFLASVEPLFAAVLAMLFLNQFLSPMEWAGFLVVLCSVFIFERLSGGSKEPSKN